MKSLAIVFLAILAQVNAIQFYLEVNTVKCLKEEVQANVLVTGEYMVMEMPNVKVEFVVRDSKGHILSMKHDIPHSRWFKFSFVTETYDTFEICFSSQASPAMYSNNAKQEISLDVKRGIEAKSYEGIGEVANLKPVEIELKRLEDLSEAIVQDFARMRKNEEEMRDTNETTNARVLYLSIFSMCCLLLLSTWQVFYLRRFFKSKKLIE